MAVRATVNQIDDALKRYYDLNKVEYSHEFADWYEENGFEDLDEEMAGGDPEECMLLEFDERDDAPFPKKKPDREAAICSLLWEICQNPKYDFRKELNEQEPLKVTSKDFDAAKPLLDASKKTYETQLKTVYNGEMKSDHNINHVLAVSQKMEAPYLIYLADMFTRDRIAAHLKTKDDISLEPAAWVNQNKHCADLGKQATKDIIQHAVTSFFHRIVPKLMLNAQTEISDSLKDTAEYILAQVEFVCNLASSGTLSCPFQVDASIAYNDATIINDLAQVPNDPVDPDLDDEDENDPMSDDPDLDDEDENKEEEKHAFEDCFGNIKKKLSSEKLVNSVAEYEVGKQTRSRAYGDQFTAFKKSLMEIHEADQDQEYKDYPRNHRFCSFIDRRKASKSNGTVDNDEIIFFEPPTDCRRIPHGHVPLWFFDSSATSIIPNIGYSENVQSAQQQQQKVVKKRKRVPANKQNITSKSPCSGALLMLSFHVEAANEIRCYLYLNGQVTRFMADDIIHLLPRYFADTEENRTFVKSADAQKMVEQVHKKLIDSKFEAFYERYKYGQ